MEITKDQAEVLRIGTRLIKKALEDGQYEVTLTLSDGKKIVLKSEVVSEA